MPLAGHGDLAVPVSDILEACYHKAAEEEMYWVQDILGTALNYQKFGACQETGGPGGLREMRVRRTELAPGGEDHEVKQHEVHAVAMLAFMLESW